MTASAAALAVAIVGVAAPGAMAQDGQAGAQERIVVTGSRIRRQDFTANSPIVTVDTNTFENTSTVGIETVLNQLPQFVPALTEFNTTTLSATSRVTPGASVVNLRGLGSFRTLTLIDGRRAMPTNGTLAVDTNMIPSSAIQRVEIISGGASAVYGADAVAGVVNFILKDDFDGVEVTSRYGMTEEGDGEQFQISALTGTSLDNGRGNVLFGAEHASRSAAYAINREWVQDSLRDPFVRGSQGQFSETYVQLTSNLPTQARINQIFGTLPSCTLPNGTGAACPSPTPSSAFYVNATTDGTGTLFTGVPTFPGTVAGNRGSFRYSGPFDDPNGSGLPYRKVNADGSISENNLQALTSLPLERYSMFGKGEYALTESINVYLQGNYAHSQTDTLTVYSPAVNNWVTTIPVGTGSGQLYTNSFLNPTLRTTANPTGAILSYDAQGRPVFDPNAATNPDYLPGGRYGLNDLPADAAFGLAAVTCGPTGGCPESYVFPMPVELRALLGSRANPNEDVRVQRVLDFLPTRQTHNRVNTSQLIFGLEGELANEWTWDASVSHGLSETLTVYDGFSSLAQYQGVTTSPNYGVNFVKQGASPTSSGTGTCTTGLPLFRDFVPSQDCVDTINVTMQNTSSMTMNVAEANLAGEFFDLPAGPIGFALGTTYREFSYEFLTDEINHVRTYIDQPIGQFAQGNTRGDLDVYELYGELLVPVVNNLPFVQQLNLELGGRMSDYSTSGEVSTYKGLVDWTVNDWMRLRGGYNRATRAPHVVELFVAPTNNGASAALTNFGDPCSQNNPAPSYGAHSSNPNSAQVIALCRELMTATAEFAFYDSRPINQQPNRPGQLPTGRVPSGVLYGNPNIEPETADTWTAGAVIGSPFDNPWLNGFNATVDWYSIEISDIIALQNAEELWRQCILSNSATSAECSVVHRDPFDGGANLVDVSYTNEGHALFTGVDVAVNWAAQFDDLGLGFIPGGVAINTQLTVPIDRETQVTPAAPVVENVGTLNCQLDLSCSGYDYSLFTTINYVVNDLSLSLRWNSYPTIDASQVATNPAAPQRGVFKEYNVFSLSGSYGLTDQLTLRAGVDNIFDKEPPLSGGSFAADGSLITPVPTLPTPPTRSGSAVYDQLGRRFFVGATATF